MHRHIEEQWSVPHDPTPNTPVAIQAAPQSGNRSRTNAWAQTLAFGRPKKLLGARYRDPSKPTEPTR